MTPVQAQKVRSNIRTNGRGDVIIRIIAYGFIGIFAAICLYPLLLMVGVSFSKEYYVQLNGYKLIPEQFSLDTYKYIFRNGYEWLISSYGVTILVTVLGTAWCLLVTSMLAYPLSLRWVKYRNVISFFCYFTQIFGAGLVPWYIVCVRYYQLSNTIAALILPYSVSVFFMFVMRSFFQSLPDALFESAKIDGAGDFTVFLKIVLPLSVTTFVTVGMLYALQFWNDWYLSLMFIGKSELYPLQYRLFTILSNAEGLSASQKDSIGGRIQVPTETVKMATTCLTIGPIVLLYPFVQRFFVSGITIGAVKG